LIIENEGRSAALEQGSKEPQFRLEETPFGVISGVKRDLSLGFAQTPNTPKARDSADLCHHYQFSILNF